MDYKSARAYIDSLTPRGIVPGLTAISELLRILCDPQDRLCAVHIAGTNGKGSVGAFLEAILRADNKTVCRFATPAVGDHLEAFTYNGEPIGEAVYARAAERVKTAAAQLEKKGIFPTSFEAETAIAFLVFSELAPDYALIECGMGGALDATNIIKAPAAAIITSISTDHTQYLGATIGEIAKNKAGIIKENVPVITVKQDSAAAEVIENAAILHNAPLYITPDVSEVRFLPDRTTFEYAGDRYTIRLAGTYQPENAAAAITAAKVLGINNESLSRGLYNAVWRYRFERIGRFILDGAHNEGAARELASSLETYTTPQNTAFIVGCFKDKAHDRIAELTAPYAAAVYCVTPPTERGLHSKVLCDTFIKHGAAAYDAGTMTSAIRAASACGYESIVIFGSLSILCEARRIIEEGQ